MDKSQGRTIFSGVQTYKADGSIDHVGGSQLTPFSFQPLPTIYYRRWERNLSRINIEILTPGRKRPSLGPSGASGTYA